jgi:hypothetical protein
MRRFVLLVLLSGCLYKMPNENTICTSPNANNPHLTREKPIQFTPGK